MQVDRRVMLLALAGGTGSVFAIRNLTARPGSPQPAARPDLYNCEGCEAVGEPLPSTLSATVVLAGSDEPGERMILTGRVLTADGTAPAAGVVIYAHHTNDAGLYANGSNQTTWSRRHGRLRGWAVTGADGRYTFRTIKPAPYPDRTMPAHVHLFVGEPGRPPYYIDDVVFDGEFGVTAAYRKAREMRGGNGIVRLGRTADGVLLAQRDIRLETHPA
ncbi:dioxygenase family protein [Sphingomonas koreensis]